MPNYIIVSTILLIGFGVAATRVATPSIALIYFSRTVSPIIIYSSRTPLPVYISTEQHREYIHVFQPNSILYASRTASYVRILTLGVATPGSGGPAPFHQRHFVN